MNKVCKIPLEDNTEIEIPKELIDRFIKSWIKIEDYLLSTEYKGAYKEIITGIMNYYYRYLHKENIETLRTFLSEEIINEGKIK